MRRRSFFDKVEITGTLGGERPLVYSSLYSGLGRLKLKAWSLSRAEQPSAAGKWV